MNARTWHRPPRRFPRMTALTCAAAAVATLAATPIAPAAGADTPAPRTAAAHPSSVVLPTGERLALRWYGDTPRVSPGAGERSPMSVATVGQHVYAIPYEAAPYIGSALDRSLFDVTELAAKQGPRGTGRMPVSLTFAGAAVDVPGVRITSRSGTHASGYLTNQSAPTFGAMLRTRLRHAPADARRAGTPVPGLTGLTLAAPSGGVVTPNFAQVTLTVKLVPTVGQTVLGASAMITNIDDGRRYTNFISIGPDNYAKVSVPKGNYAIVGSVAVAANDGTFGAFLVPIVADYAVTTNGQSVTLDPRRASAPASFSTPRPATLTYAQMDIVPTDGRSSPGRIATGILFAYSAENEVLVQPTPKPKHGVLELDTYEHRSAAGSNYDLTAEWLAGIPASLHRTVRPEELARVEDRGFSVTASGGRSFGRGPVYPDLRGVILADPATEAKTSIDYLYGPPDVRWVDSAYQNSTDDGAGSESMYSAPVRYRPGNTYRVDWFRGSLAPGFAAKVTFPQPYCVACRTADQMALTISSEQDADPNHSGFVFGAATGYSRLQVFRDGASIVDAADTDQVVFPVPPQSHDYRIEDTIDRGKLGFTTSTKTKSVYSVRSSATSGKPVPAGWFCVAPGTGACTVLPLLTANVALPTTPASTMPAGTSTFVVSVGHVPAAAKSAISKLTFATSLDGTTFRPARVIDLGNGRYEVTLTNAPATAGHPITIRVHAEDAAGATLTQTVTNAYTVTGS